MAGQGGGGQFFDKKKFCLHLKFMLSYIENIEIAYLTSKTKAAQWKPVGHFVFFKSKTWPKKQGKGGEWTQWIILTIDIRPPKRNKAVELGKLPNPSWPKYESAYAKKWEIE